MAVNTASTELAPGATMRSDSGHPAAVDHERILKRLEHISHLFDEAFRVPGTKIRLGWDSIIGLVPVVGDGLTTCVSAYVMWEANRLGVRKRTLARMLGNVCTDFVVGTIPLVGDLADVAWKANRKNVALLKRELERHRAHGPARPKRAARWSGLYNQAGAFRRSDGRPT